MNAQIPSSHVLSIRAVELTYPVLQTAQSSKTPVYVGHVSGSDKPYAAL